MPRLDALIGSGWRLIAVGRCEAASVMALADARVVLPGPAADLAPRQATARVFVAPTRFAAGIPHKVHEAAASGLPTVATGLLCRQLGWRAGAELLVGDTPGEFAHCCAALYRDDTLWSKVRKSGLDAVARDCDPDRFRADLLGILEGGVPVVGNAQRDHS
jgi:glycosyltransferase involved in cell wall biosynthesis